VETSTKDKLNVEEVSKADEAIQTKRPKMLQIERRKKKGGGCCSVVRAFDRCTHLTNNLDECQNPDKVEGDEAAPIETQKPVNQWKKEWLKRRRIQNKCTNNFNSDGIKRY